MIKSTDPVYARIDGTTNEPGIDLRTWMATQFMAADLGDQRRWGIAYADRAKDSIEAADALIAALNANPDNKPNV